MCIYHTRKRWWVSLLQGSCASIHMMGVEIELLDPPGQKHQGYVCHDNLSEMQECPCDGHPAHELQPLDCLLCDEWVSHGVTMIHSSRGSLLSVGHFSTLQACTNYNVNTGCFFFPSTLYWEIEKQKGMEMGKISQWGGFHSFYLCLQMTRCLQIFCHVFHFL